MLGIGHDGRVIGGVGVDIGGQVVLNFVLAPGLEFRGSLLRLVHGRLRLAFFDPAVAPGLHARHAVLFVAQRRLGLRIALALGTVGRIRVIGFGGGRNASGSLGAFIGSRQDLGGRALMRVPAVLARMMTMGANKKVRILRPMPLLARMPFSIEYSATSECGCQKSMLSGVNGWPLRCQIS